MAFAPQWTWTKRHSHTTSVPGSQNSTTGDFYCWKSRDFASICLRKGTASCSSLNMPSLHPSSFTRVLLTRTRRRTERSLPSLARWNSLISSQPAVTARTQYRKPRSSLVNDSLRTISCLGNHNKHSNLFKQDLQAAVHVRAHRTHVFTMKPGGTDRSVYS